MGLLKLMNLSSSDFDNKICSINIEEKAIESKQAIPMWWERWFLSSNAKDIGTLYLIFALFSGLLGTAFSVLIRLELAGPGVQYIADNQLYNAVITAHAILMIFFMVKLHETVLNKKLNLFSILSYSNYNTIENVKNYDIKIGVDNNHKSNKDLKPSFSENNNKKNNNKENKPVSVKILVENPYNNRDIILKMTKKQKGVYIWETLDGKTMYVGHSINLYNRISSYFMPSILKTKARRVLKYLNKHGFNNIKLTIYIMDENSSLDQVVALEQHFIDTLNPNLNVDLIASSSGYHEPMSQDMRNKLRKERGTPIYVYDSSSLNLLHIFESKQQMYSSINIHHKTLNDCLDLGTLYLDYFFLALDLLETSTSELLTLDQLKPLVLSKRDLYKVKHPAAKSILAEFKDDSSKNLEFHSLNSLANHLKGDRQIIREYLKKTSAKAQGYYRGKWKFTYQNS
jgi:hypothetical protein